LRFVEGAVLSNNGERKRVKRLFTIRCLAFEHDELIDRIPALTGTRDFDVAVRIVDQIGRGLVCPRPKDLDTSIVSAIGSIAAMAPQLFALQRAPTGLNCNYAGFHE